MNANLINCDSKDIYNATKFFWTCYSSKNHVSRNVSHFPQKYQAA